MKERTDVPAALLMWTKIVSTGVLFEVIQWLAKFLEPPRMGPIEAVAQIGEVGRAPPPEVREVVEVVTEDERAVAVVGHRVENVRVPEVVDLGGRRQRFFFVPAAKPEPALVLGLDEVALADIPGKTAVRAAVRDLHLERFEVYAEDEPLDLRQIGDPLVCGRERALVDRRHRARG